MGFFLAAFCLPSLGAASAQGRAASCDPLLAPLGPLMVRDHRNNAICQEGDKCCNNNVHRNSGNGMV